MSRYKYLILMYHMTVGIVSANKSFCCSTFAICTFCWDTSAGTKHSQILHWKESIWQVIFINTLHLLPIYNRNQKWGGVGVGGVFYPSSMNPRKQRHRSTEGEEKKKRKEKETEKVSNGINMYQFNPVISRTHLPFISQVTLSKSKSVTEEEICSPSF